VVNDSVKVIPRSTRDRRTSGIAQSVSHRWSSVTINRIDGRSSGASCAAAVDHDGARESANEPRRTRLMEVISRRSLRV
jgi:hypothetical protein